MRIGLNDVRWVKGKNNCTLCLLLFSSNSTNATLCLLSLRLVQHFISFNFFSRITKSSNKRNTRNITRILSHFFCRCLLRLFVSWTSWVFERKVELKNHLSSDMRRWRWNTWRRPSSQQAKRFQFTAKIEIENRFARKYIWDYKIRLVRLRRVARFKLIAQINHPTMLQPNGDKKCYLKTSSHVSRRKCNDNCYFSEDEP